MASIIKADTLQSTTSNVFILNSVGTEYARFDATGVFQLANPSSFPAGNVASPSITASGDTNTGIFFSAADTIDFVEGGTATGQFDSSGNFKFNSGYGSVATAYGCRAWVNFNGTGTVAIRASGNVSSITDNAVGNYTINFTTAMPNVNYATMLSHGYNGTGSDFLRDMVETSDSTNKTVSKTTFQCLNVNATALDDVSDAMVSIFR